MTSEEQSWLYVSLYDDKLRGTLQQIQHIPMTPAALKLKAEKENVIQSLRNNVSQQTEAIFPDHMRGKEKHFSESVSYGW